MAAQQLELEGPLSFRDVLIYSLKSEDTEKFNAGRSQKYIYIIEELYVSLGKLMRNSRYEQ